MFFQIDWFEDQYRDIQRKLNTKEMLENKKEMQEFNAALKELR